MRYAGYQIVMLGLKKKVLIRRFQIFSGERVLSFEPRLFPCEEDLIEVKFFTEFLGKKLKESALS